MTRPPRTLLKTELVCPLSGMKLGNEPVPVHKIPVVLCVNGSLYAYCSIHETRCFVRGTNAAKVMKYETPVKEVQGA